MEETKECKNCHKRYNNFDDDFCSKDCYEEYKENNMRYKRK